MVMPFISIYMIQHFNISMIQVGLLFTFVSVGNLVGGIFGGAFTDKFGRKTMALYGLLISGSFSLVIIFIHEIITLFVVIGALGFVGALGGPARGAMLADILPPEQRAEGFGILRVVVNLSATIGPALGGFLAAQSFNYIFIGDFITSAIVAIIFYFKIPETKPETSNESKTQTMSQTMGGYKDVFKDWKFLFFVGVSMLMTLVYMQMNSTLPVYIKDLGYDTQIYGYILSMNAFMVVIFQFWITRKIRNFPALIMIGIGNLLYGIGFGMYGVLTTIPFLFIAMVIITIGEMIISPFSQAVAANFAPEDKRGRYMAVFGWSGLFPTMFGVLGAGAIMETMDAKYLWYFSAAISVITMSGYFILHFISAGRFDKKLIKRNKNISKEIKENQSTQSTQLNSEFNPELEVAYPNSNLAISNSD